MVDMSAVDAKVTVVLVVAVASLLQSRRCVLS